VIRSVRPGDAAEIAAIYNHYIEETAITFEEAPVSAADMAARIACVSAKFPWLVWIDEQSGIDEQHDGAPLLGYAYLDEYHERSAYRFTVSDSIYVKADAQGRGIGNALMSRLMDEAGARGFHVVMALITSPNEPSERMHAKFGFRRAGLFPEIGYKLGAWRDVGYWQKVL
jgi:phosphinothricin acetyltransferase